MYYLNFLCMYCVWGFFMNVLCPRDLLAFCGFNWLGFYYFLWHGRFQILHLQYIPISILSASSPNYNLCRGHLLRDWTLVCHYNCYSSPVLVFLSLLLFFNIKCLQELESYWVIKVKKKKKKATLKLDFSSHQCEHILKEKHSIRKLNIIALIVQKLCILKIAWCC